MRWTISLLVMVAAFAACRSGTREAPAIFPPSATFAGRITLVIAEPHIFGEGDADRTYLYDLDAGRLELKGSKDRGSKGVEIQHFATGGISCYNSPRLQSPDGKLRVHCEGPFPGLPRDGQSDSIVVEDGRGKPVWKQAVGANLRVVGYAWAPNSDAIAIAESSNHTSRNPFDLLWAVSGHLVPVSTFGVEIFRIDGKTAQRLPFLDRELRMGFGMLAGWN